MPLLLPTHNFDKPEPSASEVGLGMAGWAGFGVLVNVVARKLQRKPSSKSVINQNSSRIECIIWTWFCCYWILCRSSGALRDFEASERKRSLGEEENEANGRSLEILYNFAIETSCRNKKCSKLKLSRIPTFKKSGLRIFM
jgi:hypothetical protein